MTWWPLTIAQTYFGAAALLLALTYVLARLWAADLQDQFQRDADARSRSRRTTDDP